MNKRVAITGIGVLVPAGIGKEDFWKALCQGDTKKNKAIFFDLHESKGMVSTLPGNSQIEKLAYKIRKTSQSVILASQEAVNDAKLKIENEDRKKIGVILSTFRTGIHWQEFYKKEKSRKERGKRFFLPEWASADAEHIAKELKILGPLSTISTTCSSGALAIGYAFDLIRYERAEVVIAGGLELSSKYLSEGIRATRVLTKEKLRPFDRKRSGTVLSEGVGILILESLDHAQLREAYIYAEIIGYGVSNDAYHLFVPDPEAEGMTLAMSSAIKEAGVNERDIDYINAHGTGTLANDRLETLAIKRVFGDYAYRIPINSTKSIISHTLGAAGVIEAIVTILSIERQAIHPTINYENPDPECDLNYITKRKKVRINTALSNSFGFGGNNVSIIFKKYER